MDLTEKRHNLKGEIARLTIKISRLGQRIISNGKRHHDYKARKGLERAVGRRAHFRGELQELNKTIQQQGGSQ